MWWGIETRWANVKIKSSSENSCKKTENENSGSANSDGPGQDQTTGKNILKLPGTIFYFNVGKLDEGEPGQVKNGEGNGKKQIFLINLNTIIKKIIHIEVDEGGEQVDDAEVFNGPENTIINTTVPPTVTGKKKKIINEIIVKIV